MFEQDLSRLTDQELRDGYLALVAEKASLEVREARWLAAMHARSAHLSPEFDRGSLALWIRSETRCSKRHASRLVRRAKTVAAFPVLASTLDGGEASAEHLDAVGNALSVIPEEAFAELEDTLIDAAVKVTVEDLSGLMTHLKHRIDPDGATESAMRRETQAGVSLDPVGSDGMVAINGLLSARDGAALLAATEPFMRPAGPDDVRTPRQRRGDALGEVARRVLANGQVPDSGGLRPQVMVVVPLSTLQGETGAPGARIVGSGVIDGKTAQAMSCDAEITRVVHDDTARSTTTGNVLDGRWKHRLAGLLAAPLAEPSVILDLGRSKRLASVPQRKALIVRDGRCVYPGCDRPPSWTEVHHLEPWWARLGSTDLNKMCLLCTFHHHELHRKDQRLDRDPDGSWHLFDDGYTAAGSPLGSRLDDAELHAVHRRLVGDGAGVGGAASERLPVGLAGADDVVVGYGREGKQLKGIDLDREPVMGVPTT
jgi:hypothetical protein